MKQVIWEVRYVSPPPAIRYCKKCGRKSEFICSNSFRVNAQRKFLDIWLIYKCSHCDTTWNSTLYSRINPQSLSSEQLEQFHTNDRFLAEQYAMDTERLRRNGAKAGLPDYTIVGEDICAGVPTELHIMSRYQSQIKIAAILREKLNLSQKAFEQLLNSEQIKSVSVLDLQKCKLHNEIILMIGTDALHHESLKE
ncbi:DUF1062 domain-containing protein [Clostridium minihomine]|uniref:DUF1062 domain-containing protein n=1 Tax=Clostridium minihomine TaxID=2045012 RepID=UPI000C75CE1D|nr:DUF1062 domain-containing protein [Clostridium minihomine]